MSLSRRNALKSLPAVALASSLPQPVRAQGAPRRGGTVSVHMGGEQRVLNPALRASTGVYVVGAKIMESLVDLDASGGIAPVLATSWQSTPDGRTITFRLRDGVKWHDGRPFTSADVQFTAMELWKKHLNYGTALQLYLDGVDTPDPLTAVFRYARPMPMQLLLRALCDLGYVAPRHVYEGTNVLDNPANAAPVGTGPFRFSKYERGQYIIVTRNDDWWRRDAGPYLDQIVFRIIPDPAAAVAALESGQVQISAEGALPLADLDRLKKDPRFEVSSRGNEGNAVMNTIEFNHRRTELADHRVREAIIRAMDVPFFCENFLYQFGQPATGPIPRSGTGFYSADTPQYPFDRKKAEALLDESGYRRRGGRRFALRLLPAPWGEDVTLWTTFMQQSLQQIGIDVEIVRTDAAGFLKSVYGDWNFDLATGWHQYRGDPAVSTTVWYRSGSPKGTPWTNQWGWQSDGMDQIIDSAAFETDAARRHDLYVKFQQQANTDAPIWMAIERLLVSVTSTKLQNHHNTPRWISSHWADLWIAP